MKKTTKIHTHSPIAKVRLSPCGVYLTAIYGEQDRIATWRIENTSEPELVWQHHSETNNNPRIRYYDLAYHSEKPIVICVGRAKKLTAFEAASGK
ncbi:MAG: hypothetical protein R3B84_11895 [Zavarzinella sp.]